MFRPRRPPINIVLVKPQIPQNTGSIGRTALVYGARLHLVGPLGFELTESRLRRAGLDYWKHVDLRTYPEWSAFTSDPSYKELTRNIVYLSKFGKQSILETTLARFEPNDASPRDGQGWALPADFQTPTSKLELSEQLLVPTTLVFGSEQKGLFQLIGEGQMTHGPVVTLPIQNPGHRKYDSPSLNLASTVGILCFETWRQQSLLLDPLFRSQQFKDLPEAPAALQ